MKRTVWEKGFWKEEQVTALCQLMKEGATNVQAAKEITKQFGKEISASAVAGARMREGIPSSNPRKVKGAKTSQVKVANVRRLPTSSSSWGGKPKANPIKFGRRSNNPNGPKSAPTVVVNTDVLSPTIKSLMDLNDGQCRWPIGEPGTKDFGYCGREAKGRYCGEHAKR